MMLFNMDGLFEKYGFQPGEGPEKWVAMIFYGMSQTLLGILITSTCMYVRPTGPVCFSNVPSALSDACQYCSGGVITCQARCGR